MSFLLLAEAVTRSGPDEDECEPSLALTKAELFKRYPRSAGSITLTLRSEDGRSHGIRALYNQIADLFMQELERSSFPYAPGDATNKWQRHEKVLLHCFQLSTSGRRNACKRLIELALEKHPPNPTFRQPTPRPRVFSAILQSYPRSNPNEEAGCAYHAIAYGYLAADRPHLHLITDRSRSSSKRQRRIGDIDGYCGADLEIAVEVKDMTIDLGNVNQQLGRFKQQVDSRGILGLVIAREVAPDAVADLKSRGVLTLSDSMLKDQVALWDLRKETIALAGMLHYLSHIEQRPQAVSRLLTFVQRHDPRHESLRYLHPQ